MAWIAMSWADAQTTYAPMPTAPNPTQLSCEFYDSAGNHFIVNAVGPGDPSRASWEPVSFYVEKFTNAGWSPTGTGWVGNWSDLDDRNPGNTPKAIGSKPGYISKFDHDTVNGPGQQAYSHGSIAEMLTTQGFLEPRTVANSNVGDGRGFRWLGYRHSSCMNWWDAPPGGMPDPGPLCVWRSWHQPARGDSDWFLIYVGTLKQDAIFLGNNTLVHSSAAALIASGAVTISDSDKQKMTQGTNFY